MVEQLNKLQLKAEILTTIAKLQTVSDESMVDEILKVLDAQEDKKAVLDILIRELTKTNEQKSFVICYLLLRLCEKEPLENALWNVLKSPAVSDYAKTVILNLLKDMGNHVDYETATSYFENADEVIDNDTKRLLHTAIMNPEAQIDFLDFLSALSETDRSILVNSLGDDYAEDALANILIPVFLQDPESKLAKEAIGILAKSKSQLALHALTQSKEFVEEPVLSLVKRSISELKLSGVREDNAIEFYSKVLSESKPYEFYSSYPDGHGNQALIFSRERENETIQFVAIVISDRFGILDCFGFNEIQKSEFQRIIDRFYGNDERVYINPTVMKTMLNNAEKLTRYIGSGISYEYICWKALLCDISTEPVPQEMALSTKYEKTKLTKAELDKICFSDYVQRWFYDTDFSSEFENFVSIYNTQFLNNNYNFDLDTIIDENLGTIFTSAELKLWQQRIFNVAYLNYLSGKNDWAQLFYSLAYDEDAKAEFFKNILRKSIYEYYVALKFKEKEQSQTTNIFRRKSDKKECDYKLLQLDIIIAAIEEKWVKDV